VVREALLVGIAAAASFVFLNHEILYLDRPFQVADSRIEPYLLATAILYLFLRLVIAVAEMRPARAPAELVRCPECGQRLDDRSAAGLEAHRRIELTPRPSPKEVVSAVALRKAVDAARFGPHSPAENEGARVPIGQKPVNLADADLLAALNDPDFLERARHSPQPPPDPRLKR
jgi:hypothetical protein